MSLSATKPITCYRCVLSGCACFLRSLHKWDNQSHVYDRQQCFLVIPFKQSVYCIYLSTVLTQNQLSVITKISETVKAIKTSEDNPILPHSTLTYILLFSQNFSHKVVCIFTYEREQDNDISFIGSFNNSCQF